jgi:four helix bundle protein
VGSNLAEGSKRKSPVDKARIFNIAQGEAAEVMSLLDLAVRLRLGRKEEAERLGRCYDELVAMIASLCQKITA